MNLLTIFAWTKCHFLNQLILRKTQTTESKMGELNAFLRGYLKETRFERANLTLKRASLSMTTSFLEAAFVQTMFESNVPPRIEMGFID